MSANEICDLLLRAAPYSTLRSAAHERAVAALASSVGIDCDVTALQDAADRFRLEHGLVTYDQTLAWLSGRRRNPTILERASPDRCARSKAAEFGGDRR